MEVHIKTVIGANFIYFFWKAISSNGLFYEISTDLLVGEMTFRNKKRSEKMTVWNKTVRRNNSYE